MTDRLISADALKAALQGLYQVAGWEKRDIHFSLSDMECNIDYMPTIEAVPLEDYRSMEQTVYKLTQALAEAEPIKHGHWIVLHGVLAGDDIYGDMGECSNCGLHLRNWEWNFCPCCGAKMDEVEE